MMKNVVNTLTQVTWERIFAMPDSEGQRIAGTSSYYVQY